LAEGDEVIVSQEAVRLLRQLDERGILLSIASKNEREAASAKLRELGLEEYFLYPQMHWGHKSQSIRTIAERLNIGIDSLAFVDDNPFELDEVARTCPEVLCLNAEVLSSLSDDPRFQGNGTREASSRRQLYRDAAKRETAQESFGQDYLGFLSSCEVRLDISPFEPHDAERVAELVQRTNQLNFSGHKHTRSELQDILSNPLLEKFVLKSQDRYGSYGTVGFCIVERAPSAILIRDLMLSCRVQGKLLEKAFFHHLLEHHRLDSPPSLWINFSKTGRNTPALRILESLGFQPGDAAAGPSGHGMILDAVQSDSLRCEIIEVSCSACPPCCVSPAISPTGQLSAPE